MIIAFIGKSAPDIRKKLQQIEGLQDYTIRDVVREAEKVYHKREREKEERNEKERRGRREKMRIREREEEGEDSD